MLQKGKWGQHKAVMDLIVSQVGVVVQLDLADSEANPHWPKDDLGPVTHRAVVRTTGGTKCITLSFLEEGLYKNVK